MSPWGSTRCGPGGPWPAWPVPAVPSPALRSRTPLHCAASCNSVHLCKQLVESGAAIFASTISDIETAADKCEEMEEGYIQCSQFLYGTWGCGWPEPQVPPLGAALVCAGRSLLPPGEQPPCLVRTEVTHSLRLIPKNMFENPCQKDSCQIAKNKQHLSLCRWPPPPVGEVGGLGNSRLSVSGAQQGLEHS